MAENRNKTGETRPFLEVRGLRKDFGGVRALKDINLQVYPGEIHGLVGANGAGKSTLIKILAGLQSADMGTVLIDGDPVNVQDPQHADRLGLQFIHQELNLVPKFNSLQNITLGMPKKTRLGLVDWRAEQLQVAAVIERLGIDFSLNVPVENLSVANQWLVSMGRALVRKARLIAMDEPTASLSPVESERLFRVVEELSDDGISIIYVSHRLDEILDLCNRITVFKDGERVNTVDRQATTKGSLIQDIVGGEVEETPESSAATRSDSVLLEVHNLRREPAVRGVSFVVHQGEILGLAGLVGSGRSELVRLIFGADPAESGEVLLDGELPAAPRAIRCSEKGGRTCAGGAAFPGAGTDEERSLQSQSFLSERSQVNEVVAIHGPATQDTALHGYGAAARYQSSVRENGSRAAERRKSAKGRNGQVAYEGGASPHAGRAVARCRHWSTGGDPHDNQRDRRERVWSVGDLFRGRRVGLGSATESW